MARGGPETGQSYSIASAQDRFRPYKLDCADDLDYRRSAAPAITTRNGAATRGTTLRNARLDEEGGASAVLGKSGQEQRRNRDYSRLQGPDDSKAPGENLCKVDG